jgi:hypothetical protein
VRGLPKIFFYFTRETQGTQHSHLNTWPKVSKAYEQGKKLSQYCLFKIMDHCFPYGGNSKTENMISFVLAVLTY